MAGPATKADRQLVATIAAAGRRAIHAATEGAEDRATVLGGLALALASATDSYGETLDDAMQRLRAAHELVGVVRAARAVRARPEGN